MRGARRRRSHGCRGGGQEGGDGRHFCRRALLAGTAGLSHLGGRRYQVAGLTVLRQLGFILPDALDRVLGSLDVRVRHNDQFRCALALERAQPFALFIEQERRDVHRQLRDDLGGMFLAQLLANQAQHRQCHRLDAADAADPDAARADDVARFPERGPQTLAGHLEQAEARELADLDAGPVHLHRIAQPILDFALILARLHVDEVDDDQAADVPDPQLTGDFVGSLEIGVKCGGLDVTALGGARRVDVDRDQRLGVIDDDAAARGQLHLVRVGGLDLALDLKAREERDVIGVLLQPPLRIGGHETLHVLLGLLEGGRIIDQHFGDIVGEVIAQCPGDRIAFPVDQKRCRAAFGGRGDLVPLRFEVIEVPLQLLGAAANAGGAHDRAHALGDVQLIHHLAHLVAVLALDAARDTARTRIVRHQYQEAPGEAEEGGQRRAFVAALFLFDLDDQLLAFGEQLADVHPSALRRLAEVIAGDFFQRQKAVARGAVVDEAGFEGGFDSGDTAFVDVRFLLFAGGYVDTQIKELLSIDQCDSQFLFLSRVHEHSFHVPLLLYGEGPASTREAAARTRCGSEDFCDPAHARES